MQTSSGSGVVQWINPPVKRSKRDFYDRNSYQNDDYKEENIFYGGENGTKRIYTGNSRYTNQNQQVNRDTRRCDGERKPVGGKQQQQPVINISICRIICTIVEQHLGELQDHQKLVNRARINLANSEPQWKFNEPSCDPILIYRRDIWKLKVRDQQTKAIETIKQLTNYLREITNLMANNQLVESDDDIFNRLSDIRTDIVQALNDFVLSNSDIDIPIFNSEDCYDYDLCADVGSKYSTQEQEKVLTRRKTPSLMGDISSGGSTSDLEEDSAKVDSASVICFETSAQFTNLDKRKQDIERLEKDTEQLRVLFSDFYNLVKSHGEQVDSIEDNIVIAIQRVGSGAAAVAGDHHQHHNSKVMRGLTILVPVTGCMAGVLVGGPLGLVVGGKLGGITIACATSLLGLISSYKMRRCMI